jgi:acetyl esterase/lipase
VFPGNDPCANIVMTASIVSGLAQLVRYARSHQHPAIVVCATSLGAHLAALLATLPAAELVDGFILDKPLGQLSDLIRWHARGDSVWCHHVADRLQRVYRSVCPLDRRPKVAPERVTVIGAEFDRVTPMSAAQQVADHFQVELRPIKASHLFDPGRSSRLLQVLTEQRVRSASCE